MKRKILTSALLCSFAAGLPLATAHADTLPELPLTGPAYLIAEQAYRAYARGDYAEAARQAREAVRLRPDLPRLRMLLQQAEAAARPRTPATTSTPSTRGATRNAASTATGNPKLAAAAAKRASAAMEREAWRDALTQINQAIAQAPAVLPYRLVQIDALLRLGDIKTARAAVDAALAVDSRDAVALAFAAYLQQRNGHEDIALAQYMQALRGNALSDEGARNMRLIAADAALAAQDNRTALQILAPLPDSDAQARERRLYADEEQRSIETQTETQAETETQIQAAPRTRLRPTAPALRCRIDHAAMTCIPLPAGSPSQALAAAAAQAASENRIQEALNLYDRALRIGGPNADLTGRRDAMRGLLDLEFAYIAMREQSPELATQTFKEIDAAGQLPARSLQDAGFAALNANERRTASGYFRRAVDAAASNELPLTPQQLFETRRAVSETDRQWGYYVAANYRGSNLQAGAGNTVDQGDTLQVGAEAYWRPEKFNRNGTYIDLYGRVTGNAYAAESTSTNQNGQSSRSSDKVGLPTLLGAVGIRWKPLRKINLIAAFERQFPIGSNSYSYGSPGEERGGSRSDWLARIGYSYDFGMDLRVDVRNWNTLRLFAEAGHYFQNKTNYVTSESQFGRSFRLFNKTVLTPHLVAAADYSTLQEKRPAIGAGVGVNLRQWLREDRYHAPQSYIDFSIQYRRKLVGDDRANGWFVRSIFNY